MVEKKKKNKNKNKTAAITTAIQCTSLNTKGKSKINRNIIRD